MRLDGQHTTRRRGPRPLALHLGAARGAWLRSGAGGNDRATFQAFLDGVRRYRDHPFRRPQRGRPVVWHGAGATLLDGRPEGGFPVLVVPSLINRACILDLMPGSSFIDNLAAAGLRPLLLDWGAPDMEGRRVSLDGVILGPLAGALEWIRQRLGRRPVLVGYCMGGTLALGLATHRAHDMAGLALLAAPFDFHAGGFDGRGFEGLVGGPVSTIGGLTGALPVDLLQAMFAARQPLEVPRKFARFAGLPADHPVVPRFVAVEDWLNDGVPLGAEITAECLIGWYGRNVVARGGWRVGGMTVRPDRLRLPVLLALPERDRIVPEASAATLIDRLPASPTVICPRSGHVGMVISDPARGGLYPPLIRWLLSIAAMQEGMC